MPTNSESSPRITGWIRSAAVFIFALIIALIANFVPKSENVAIRITVFVAMCLIYLAGLALASWPLTSLRKVWMSALLMAAGYISIASINMWQALRTGLIHRRSAACIVLVSVLFAFWVGYSAIGSLLVWVRRRYWPIFPPGHCKKCGYCLFGLTTRRCPECGTPFMDSQVDAAEVGPC